MRLTYVLLSPTFGMHQYTADLANRMAAAGHHVSLVTTTLAPRDRYGPGVALKTPAAIAGTGLSPHSLQRGQYRAVAKAILETEPDVVHFTGPHIWNPGLMGRAQAARAPAVHTIHDLDPHNGRRFGFLLRPWNRAILQRADKILVHGQVYRQRLITQGTPAERVVYAPLLHLFLGHDAAAQLDEQEAGKPEVSYEPQLLFFGRLEAYKGVEYLLTAYALTAGDQRAAWRLVLAGPGKLETVWTGSLPQQVELRNRLISDAEALDLFRRSSLILLPYIDATQSALIGAAYYFQKPVLITRSGALPEYVIDGKTGFIVEPGHPATLARALAVAMDGSHNLRQMGEDGRQWYERQRRKEGQMLQALYDAF